MGESSTECMSTNAALLLIKEAYSHFRRHFIFIKSSDSSQLITSISFLFLLLVYNSWT